MSGIASPRGSNRLFWGWVVFAAAGCALVFLAPGIETIPFHLVWISLALVYGLYPWSTARITTVLIGVSVATCAALYLHARNEVIGWEETAEVPLMALLVVLVAWQVRRRVSSLADTRHRLESEVRIREAQRRFVRFASHELRTPLTVARGYAELIHENPDAPSVDGDATVVLDELDRLEGITTRLLQMAEVDGTVRLSPTPVDLDRLLTTTTRRWGPTADRHWLVDVDAGPLRVDSDRIVAALDCLLENAVQHTARGGTIEVTAQRRDHVVTVRVIDDGAGIPPDDLPYVFERFHSGRRGGTGLGLAIVSAIVDAHGGQVEAANRADGGAAFTITLPRRAGQPAHAGHVDRTDA